MLAEGKWLDVPLMAGHTTGDMGDAFGRKPTKESIREAVVGLVGEEAAEEVMKAADYAADVQRPMAYMDALMTRYAEKGIRRAEEAEKDRREFSGQ